MTTLALIALITALKLAITPLLYRWVSNKLDCAIAGALFDGGRRG
jgi:hypothetical protein